MDVGLTLFRYKGVCFQFNAEVPREGVLGFPECHIVVLHLTRVVSWDICDAKNSPEH